MILHQRTKNYDMMLDCRDMAQDKHIILGKFLPFNPVTGLKKTLRDIMISHQCIKNYDNVCLQCYGSEQTERSFQVHFCPFTLLAGLKIIFLKKIKKTPKIHLILHQCTKNCDHMIYGCQGQTEGLRHKKTGRSDAKSDMQRCKISHREGDMGSASIFHELF